MLIGGIAVLLAAILTVVPIASGETTHVYSVSLTISVDRAAAKIDGTIVTEAPSEFCDSSTVRILRVVPGKDKVIARIYPYGAEWHMKSPPTLRGERIYAELLPYHLPSRPVECLGARSRTVTAP